MSELVVYGATGSTGHRVAELAVEAGVRPVVAGRNRESLEALAAEHGGLEVRVAEREPAALDRAFDGATVVVSSAGPYSRIGRPVADAAVRAGAHHIDFSGEPRWVQELIEEVDGPARAAGVAVVPAVGGGIAADLAAQVAARPIEADIERMTVVFRIVGMKPSGATVRSTVELVAGGAPVVSAGTTTFEKAGSRTKDFPDGPGALFSTPDALLLGRVWPQAHCEAYVQYPAFWLSGRAFAAAGAGLRRPGLLSAARKGLERADGALSNLHGGGGHSTATAIAEGGDDVSIARAQTGDIYDLSARAAWVAAEQLLAADAPPTGVRAWGEVTGPAEAAAAAVGVSFVTD